MTYSEEQINSIEFESVRAVGGGKVEIIGRTECGIEVKRKSPDVRLLESHNRHLSDMTAGDADNYYTIDEVRGFSKITLKSKMRITNDSYKKHLK